VRRGLPQGTVGNDPDHLVTLDDGKVPHVALPGEGNEISQGISRLGGHDGALHHLTDSFHRPPLFPLLTLQDSKLGGGGRLSEHLIW